MQSVLGHTRSPEIVIPSISVIPEVRYPSEVELRMRISYYPGPKISARDTSWVPGVKKRKRSPCSRSFLNPGMTLLRGLIIHSSLKRAPSHG